MEKGYVDLIALVANFQVAIDAVLVNVRDEYHVGHSFVRQSGTLATYIKTCNLILFWKLVYILVML